MARTQYKSNVVLFELPEGYSQDEATVTIQAGMKSGSVLELVGGKYVWVVAANVANAVAVLADERADVDGGLAAGDAKLKVITRVAIVGSEYLNFADAVTSGNIDAAKAALLAVGIKSGTQV